MILFARPLLQMILLAHIEMEHAGYGLMLTAVDARLLLGSLWAGASIGRIGLRGADTASDCLLAV